MAKIAFDEFEIDLALGPRREVQQELREEIQKDLQETGRRYPPFEIGLRIERCFHLESSTDLGDPRAKVELDSWLRSKCKKDLAAPGASTFIVASAVLSGEVDDVTSKRGKRVRRTGRGRVPSVGQRLYVQHFNYKGAERDTFDSSSAWAVLLWERSADLAAAARPSVGL